MLRHNNIKGISMNNKTSLLSQYADDTQILLDGTEKSLKVNLDTLNAFYNISELKILLKNQMLYGLAHRVTLELGYVLI